MAANEYTCIYLLQAIDRFRREFPHITVTVHRMLASHIPRSSTCVPSSWNDLLSPRSGALPLHRVYADSLALIVSPAIRWPGQACLHH